MTSLPYPPPFMDLATLAEHVCAGETTIENWVKLGQFPAPRMQGGKRLWRWKEVERHLAGEAEQVTTAPADHAERIRDATRKALQRTPNKQGHVRDRDQGVRRQPEVSEPR